MKMPDIAGSHVLGRTMPLALVFLLAVRSVDSPVARERCFALTAPDAKRRFVASPALEREVVLLPDDPDSRDLKALGLALHADLMPVGDRWQIVRPNAMTRDLEGADAAWLRSQAVTVVSRVQSVARRNENSPSQGVMETLQHARAQFEAGRGTKYDFSSTQAQEVAPAGRLLASILQELPKTAWTAAHPGAVTVFSNRPVTTESPLIVRDPLLKAYEAAQRRFTDWAQGPGMNAVEERDRWFLPEGPFRSGERTLLLRVSRQSDQPQFTLAVFDKDGRFESAVTLETDGWEAGTHAVPDKTAPVKTSLGVAEIPSEGWRDATDAVPGSPHFRADLLDPEKRDPLDGLVRESLLLYGHAKGCERVVACVPDSLLQAVQGSLIGSKLDLDRLDRALAETGVEEIRQEGTLILRPAHPVFEEALRVDRRPLAEGYRRASRGAFDLDALLALHAAYAGEYENRPFLGAVEASICDAFHLSDSPNWSLPHGLLAVLGELSPGERGRLASKQPLRLGWAAHPKSLPALVESLDAQSMLAQTAKSTGAEIQGAIRVEGGEALSALAVSSTRLLAAPEGVSLFGSSETRTLVKRVARGRMTMRTFNPTTGVLETQSGENLLFDKAFLPFDAKLLMGGPSADPAQALATLDRRFRFFWSQERQIPVVAVFGGAIRLGPMTLREQVGRSKTAVPLAEVPGVRYSPAQP